jgi:hypothetical protein
MLVNNIRRTITEPERDKVIAEFVEHLANTGPFHDPVLFVEADHKLTPTERLTSAGIDDAHKNRLVVLDPAQFSLRNGMEQTTLDALSAALGLGTGAAKVPVTWASSAVFSVVNTQRRAHARKIAVEYLAAKKALDAPEVQNDADLKRSGSGALTEAKEQLEKTLRRLPARRVPRTTGPRR